jgi:ferredoxin
MRRHPERSRLFKAERGISGTSGAWFGRSLARLKCAVLRDDAFFPIERCQRCITKEAENQQKRSIIATMPAAPGATKAVGMVPDEMKWEPKSKGLTTPRKKKPKELAVITECCTGCAGSPACVEYCPVEDCMFWVPDEDNVPFGRIAVDPILCIGCKKCLSKGPDGCFLDGCPWDAIVMVETTEVEKEVGAMAI